MQATVVDLRYKMNDILKALDRNEEVTILYHGKIKGIIKSASNQPKTQMKMKEHPFFGMQKSSKSSVLSELARLRKPRYHAI